jgi:hypothetical protein
MIDTIKKKTKKIWASTWRPESTTLIAVALIVAGIVLRIIPHTANFAPVGAIALFGGAVLTARYALWVPLVIMVISDFFIGFHGTMLFTWGGFVLVGMYGMFLRERSNAERIPLGALGSALIFFIVSNFGVWVEGKLYPHTLQGLADCFVAAIPFLRTSLVADLLFASVLFGTYALSTKLASRAQSAPAVE